jgi:glycosidase
MLVPFFPLQFMKNLRRLSPLLTLFLLLGPALALSPAPQVNKVEPPNWWANYVSPVMVLLYGSNLADAKVTANYPGIKVQKVEAQPDGKHAFVWLDIAKDARPGTASLAVKTSSGEAKVDLPLLVRQPQQGRFQGVTRDDVIYLIMPDRFADGDTANNVPAGAVPGTYNRAASKTYHGGDLKGITRHLGYIKDLGATTLWLTPITDNDNSTSDYHGYGAVDLYKVEDHFGAMADFQQLVATAHEKGMKVLLDMVPNHVGPKHPWADSQPAPGWLHGTPQKHLNTDYNFSPISDPHATEANYVKATNGWFANVLPDLAQENPLTAQYLLQNALWWAESSGVDGFRIDTFPYVPRTFWAYYLQGVFAQYPKFFTVGEIYNTDPTVTSYWAGGSKGFDGVDTLLTTPFDFPMQDAIDRVINQGAPASLLAKVLRQDRLFPHPELLVTFIGNHDMPRFTTAAGGSKTKLLAAFSLLATLRGIPQIYYGDEIGMAGGNDPDDRHDFPGGFAGDPHNAFTETGRTPEEQSVYTQVQSLLKLRRDHPALREGLQKHLAVGDDYYIFTRETAGERLLVVFYKGFEPSMQVDLAGTSIADAKSFTPLFGAAPVVLNRSVLSLQLPPATRIAVYRVE